MNKKVFDFTCYNREERDICAHLFRLILHDQPRWRPLCQFLGVERVSNPRVFCEVALIRDAYHARKPDSEGFMVDMVEFIARQQGISNYTGFNELPDTIKDPGRTHPKQIRQKLLNKFGELSESDNVVYGAVQAMFNAKPDLTICTGDELFIFEAKYTLGFNQEQLRRTTELGEVWSKLLYHDLGFINSPRVEIRTLGLSKFTPDVTWDKVREIAADLWGPDDFSTRVLSKVSCIRGEAKTEG